MIRKEKKRLKETSIPAARDTPCILLCLVNDDDPLYHKEITLCGCTKDKSG